MKIIIAPQAFKESISALAAAQAMRDGVLRVFPEANTVLVPVADGGDGTLETLVEGSGGQIHSTEVTGPLGDPIKAQWGALGDGITAIVEMARTSGLTLVPIENRDPRITTTYGLGQIISKAMSEGFRCFVVGIGGSATNDAGAGMAQALGVRLLDSLDNELPFGGATLIKLARIDMSGLDPRVKNSRFLVACDVTNPMTGDEGASAVYGPQKGATPEMVNQLDEAIEHFTDVVERDIGAKIKDVPGAGAAGGLGGGMIAFLNGRLQTGIDIVLRTIEFDKSLEGASLVITGEGSLDYQTIYNKAPIGVARLAKSIGIPVISISGSLGDRFQYVHSEGIDAAFAITNSPMSLEEASTRVSELVASATEQAMRAIKIGVRFISSG